MSVLNAAYEAGYRDAPTLAKTATALLATQNSWSRYPDRSDLRSAYRDGWYAAMCDLSESGNGDDN